MGTGICGRGTVGSSADVPLSPQFSNGKDLKEFLFCRKEANGEEEKKYIGNRRESRWSKFTEETGVVELQLTDEPQMGGTHQQRTTMQEKGWC